MSFLNSIEKKSKKFENPFTHWELNQPLTDFEINEIIKADIKNPSEYDLNYVQQGFLYQHLLFLE